MKKNYLIVVCGLVGTGKTTVAKYLASKIKAVLFATDDVRRSLMSRKKYLVFPKSRRKSYSREEKNVVYNAIFFATKHLLSHVSVIIDGTFDLNRYLKEAQDIARAKKSKLKIIECILDPETVAQRVTRRFRSKKGVSLANYFIYKLVRKKYQSIKLPHFKLDTGKNWRRELNAWIKKNIK